MTSAFPRTDLPHTAPPLPLAVESAFCPPGLGPNVQSFLALVEIAGRSILDQDVPTAGHALRQALVQREVIEQGARARIEKATPEICARALRIFGQSLKRTLTPDQQDTLAALVQSTGEVENSKLAEAWSMVLDRFAPPISSVMRNRLAKGLVEPAAEGGEDEPAPVKARFRPLPRYVPGKGHEQSRTSKTSKKRKKAAK